MPSVTSKLIRARLPRRRPDVTLVLPPLWGVDRPPLNLAYLASYLRGAGLRVKVEDLNILAYQQLRASGLGHLWTIGTLDDLKPMALYHMLVGPAERLLERGLQRILRSDSPVVGMFLNTANRHTARWLAQRMRELDPRRTIVFGGPEVLSLLEEQRLHRFSVDYYVFGEGEQTLLEITRRVLAGGPVGTVPGALPGPHLADWTVRPARLLARPPLKDLDRIPSPTYEDFDLTAYPAKTTLPFLFSRGCPARCVFCIDCKLGPHFRCRSGAHAAEEMAFHVRHHGRRVFTFNDLICNGDMGRLEDLAREILRRRLEVRWSSYAMIHPGLTPAALKLLAASGCSYLHFGFESGSDRILRRMRKPYRSDLAQQVVRDTAAAGIHSCINIIVGFPCETDEDFKLTLDFVRRNQGAISTVQNVSSLALLRGSAMAKDPTRYGIAEGQREAWEGADGMNEAVRRERVERVMDLLEELKIPLTLVNCTHEEKVVWH